MLYDNIIYDVCGMKNAVGDILDAVCGGVCLSGEAQYRIRLVLNELICNSLRYSDSDRGVRLLAKLCGDEISMAVMDYGDGFDCGKAVKKDISREDMLLAEGGRGIFIASAVCSRFKFNRKGNIIAIRLNLV